MLAAALVERLGRVGPERVALVSVGAVIEISTADPSDGRVEIDLSSFEPLFDAPGAVEYGLADQVLDQRP